MRLAARRHWIPPFALLYSQIAHGFAWLLLLWIAWSANLGNALYGFAWIHTVALAWVTMAALAILIHALPNFIDAPWSGELAARWSIAAYGCGVAVLIFGFLTNPAILPAGATLLFLALIVYLATAFATIAGALRGEHASTERVPRAVARAFAGTFVFLLATAVIGLGLAWMLGGYALVPILAALPGAHANLGTLGWLSLLIFGVSQRTIRPISEQTTRMRRMHIAVGACAVAGVPVLAAGVASSSSAAAWIGGVLFAIGALCYAIDTIDIIVRARNPHRAPQLFIVAAIFWLLVSLAIGTGVLAGKPWQQAYVFVLLMGWVGQFVNAHLYHIGVRLLATVYRGEDDETPPQALLEPRLSWFTLYAFQVAVGAITYALMFGNASLVARAAVFGITGWIAMIANVMAARARALAPSHVSA